MKLKRKVQAVIKEHVQLTSIHCDFCGQDLDQVPPSLSYDASAVTIEARLGPVYPGGDSDQEVYEVDCCKDCWRAKVWPALQQLAMHPLRPRDSWQSELDVAQWEEGTDA